ncbi:protein gp37 [Bradyrhizobium sp. USDA 4501]
MAETSIEWTEATWNPIVGCSIATAGCTNCYAMRMAARIEAMGTAPHYSGTTKRVRKAAIWTGKLALAPESVLLAPLRRRRPTTWFVNSMGDLFHEDCPDEWINRVFAIMAQAPNHTFQVLTKRAWRMHDYMRVRGGPILPNVWLGVSTERQKEADERIPLLLQTPSTVRFISAEPLLGPINLRRYVAKSSRRPALDWVIVGGESGPRARPMAPAWVESLRLQCGSGNVKFFFKQWGGKNKKAAGRLLNGQIYDDMPALSM